MKNVIVKYETIGKGGVVKVLAIDNNPEEEMVFFSVEDLKEFLPEFLKDFYNTTNYTLQKA
jgi:hypothetical protein